MTVLLVDDQISILSGLISGIDWDGLGITSIRTASNAFSAKGILRKEKIDILLCDIEMPGENGLDLLRWARKEHMDFVCVFLTSHADFIYAKEAIKLGCFDYVLQPARYEDIQNTVAKAIDQVKKNRAEKELAQYGAVARVHNPGLFQNLFNDWAAGKLLSVDSLCDVLHQLGRKVAPEDNCLIILGHILKWHSAPWHSQEWVFTMNNVLTELYEKEHYGILSFTIDTSSMGWLIFSLPKPIQDLVSVTAPLQNAYDFISQHMRCEIAFYCSQIAPLSQINTQSESLLHAKMDNILQKSGVFLTGDGGASLSSVLRHIDSTQIHRWEELLTHNDGKTTCEEVFRFFDEVSSRRKIDHHFLRVFWIQFQQITLNALWAQKRELDILLPLLEKGEKARFLSDMRKAVRDITACFNGESSLSSTANRVEQARRYLEDNIDLPLTASDIASALFINMDYLSRQFKKEYGLTLKEYILKRKMESAQSLLRTTTLPVSVIASKLGYDNFSHFSQVYRRVMGISPTDERRDPS